MSSALTGGVRCYVGFERFALAKVEAPGTPGTMVGLDISQNTIAEFAKVA